MEDKINTKGDQVKNLVLKKWSLRSVIGRGGYTVDDIVLPVYVGVALISG